MTSAVLDMVGPISKVELFKKGKVVGRSSTFDSFNASRDAEGAAEAVMRQAGLSHDDVDAAIVNVMVRRQDSGTNHQVGIVCLATLNLVLESGYSSRYWTLKGGYFHYAILDEA